MTQVDCEGSDDVDKQSSEFRTVPPKRVTMHAKECRFGKRCRHGINCSHKHSDDDKKYFKGKENKGGNPLRKVQMCKNYEEKKCKRAASNCDYAHGDKDAWCLRCRRDGHFAKDCPK